MNYIPKYFIPQEFVSSEMFKKEQENALARLDEKIVRLADKLYELFDGIMVINTWALDSKKKLKYGFYRYRGYREKNCIVGSKTGAHYVGKAIDFDIYLKDQREKNKDVIKKILQNRKSFPEIKGIEVANWNHVDVMERENQKDKICLFDRKGFLKWI